MIDASESRLGRGIDGGDENRQRVVDKKADPAWSIGHERAALHKRRGPRTQAARGSDTDLRQAAPVDAGSRLEVALERQGRGAGDCLLLSQSGTTRPVADAAMYIVSLGYIDLPASPLETTLRRKKEILSGSM